MKLKEYLNRNHLPVSVFAQKIGVSRDTVYRWIRETWIPNYNNREKIMKITKGKVKHKDFYDN